MTSRTCCKLLVEMNSRQLILFVSVVVVLGGLFVLLTQRNKTQPTSWNTHYLPDSKDPYGTQVLRKLLDDYNDGFTCTYANQALSERLPANETGATYLVIKEAVSISEEDCDSLESFIRRGNTAFIAAQRSSHRILCNIFDYCDEQVEFWNTTRQRVSLQLDSAQFPGTDTHAVVYYYNNVPAPAAWSYVRSPVQEMEVLGHFNQRYPNFVRLQAGKGYLYLLTTPIVLSNVALLEHQMLKYDEKLLSYLPKGNIYWDQAFRYDPWEGPDQTELSGDGPFRYLLAQPALQWSWYILIALAILFVVFKAKRTQRTIPVLEPNTNTSLQFIQTMGRLYRLKNDHKRMVELQMSQFLSHARDHYRIPTTEEELDLAGTIAIKSGVPKPAVAEIFAMHENLSRQDSVRAGELATFHQLLQHFYATSK